MARIQRLGNFVEIEVDFQDQSFVFPYLSSSSYVISYSNVFRPVVHFHTKHPAPSSLVHFVSIMLQFHSTFIINAIDCYCSKLHISWCRVQIN